MKTSKQIEEQFNELNKELAQLQARAKEINEEMLRLQGEHRLAKEYEIAESNDIVSIPDDTK